MPQLLVPGKNYILREYDKNKIPPKQHYCSMNEKIALVLCYGVMYAAFHAWTDNTDRGKALKKFLSEWKTDWVHGLLVSGSVFILSCCAIVALALTFRVLGI